MKHNNTLLRSVIVMIMLVCMALVALASLVMFTEQFGGGSAASAILYLVIFLAGAVFSLCPTLFEKLQNNKA